MSSFFNRIKPLNIDITHRCPLQCPKCARQEWFRDLDKSIPGRDLSIDEFEKITDYFKQISFCGQLSDPIHHPRFINFLETCYKKKCEVEVHTASSFKSSEWFTSAFKACLDAQWIFGIDGLPRESHRYRINQDGEKLYNVMLDAKNILEKKPIWQYIVFKYNENHVEKARKKAFKNGLGFMILESARWLGDDDPYKPSKLHD